MRKSREKGILNCSCCDRKISKDEFNANGGYCDTCRGSGKNDFIVDAVKSGVPIEEAQRMRR